MKKTRKVFYSIISKEGIVGLEEQDGFEIKVDGEKFNTYRNEYKDRVYIIDPQTGLAIYIYDYQQDEDKLPSEFEMTRRAIKELIEDKERLKKWQENKSKESYILMVQMFAAYRQAEELREKQKEAVIRELAQAEGKEESQESGGEA